MTKQAPAAFLPSDGPMNASSGVRSPRRPTRSSPPLGHGRLSLFMRNEIRCPTCRTVRALTGRGAPHRLHVMAGDEGIAITVADDLHNPGKTLCGYRILEGENATVFRLMSTPFDWLRAESHAPAAGVAVLGRRDGQWTLQVLGTANSLVRTVHDCLIDAVEVQE